MTATITSVFLRFAFAIPSIGTESPLKECNGSLRERQAIIDTEELALYQRYGRGITVCDEWREFSAFEAWALDSGFSVELGSYECTLDRIDVNGNYEPNNCRWVDMKTQQNNKRNNVAYRQTGS